MHARACCRARESRGTVANSWPRAGQRILGLGDLGASGMGIPLGKAYLYSAAAGFPPQRVLPVLLDVGCDNEPFRNSAAYAGVPRPRERGAAYDVFVGEFHAACQVRGLSTAGYAVLTGLLTLRVRVALCAQRRGIQPMRHGQDELEEALCGGPTAAGL